MAAEAGDEQRAKKRRMRDWAAIRKAVPMTMLFERDGGVCQLCGEGCLPGDATRDHILPWSAGGSDELWNLQLAHQWCNTARDNEMPGTVELLITYALLMRGARLPPPPDPTGGVAGVYGEPDS